MLVASVSIWNKSSHDLGFSSVPNLIIPSHSHVNPATRLLQSPSWRQLSASPRPGVTLLWLLLCRTDVYWRLRCNQGHKGIYLCKFYLLFVLLICLSITKERPSYSLTFYYQPPRKSHSLSKYCKWQHFVWLGAWIIPERRFATLLSKWKRAQVLASAIVSKKRCVALNV